MGDLTPTMMLALACAGLLAAVIAIYLSFRTDPEELDQP